MINLRNEARGRECQIRIPNVCCGDTDTVVLCHLPSGGMGTKSDNIHGAWGCHKCHAVIDGHAHSDIPRDLLKLWMLEAVVRTQQVLRSEGKIHV